ncbi:MAG: DNRLRE domain-containing protein [Lachnospiraceae bacterium]|nr:DNRLRE domain-containing protein [Lachnospiraceae bacterium]
MKTNNNKINMNAGAFVKEAAAKEESIKAASRLVRECPEGRNQFTRVFETADGEKAAVLYPVPVHVKKDGKWEAVDNRLRASEDGKTFENGSAVLKVRLAGNGCDDELAAVEKDGFCLSWGLCREKEVTLASFKASAVVPFEVKTTLDAEKQKTMEKNREETASSVISLAASNLTSGGTYKDILPGVDIRYRLESDVLKEAVILKTKEAASRSLTFTLKHKGLKVLPDGVGGLCFRNEKTDTEVFCMDVPVLEDAHGALLRGFLKAEEKEKGESILIICWDQDWMDDPERVFPVTVDPTVRTPSSSAAITDAYVVSARPDEHLTGTYGEMEVGKNRVNQVCRSFLRFDTLPEIEPASVITKAVLNIYTFNYSADSGLPFMVSAHEVMGGWSSSAVSWNTQPEFESTALDYVYFEPTGNQAIPKSFDVTKLVKQWYNNPSTNNGIALKAVDETTYGYCMVVASDMDPSWYGLPTECLPTGIIYYRSAKGLEDYFSYHSQSLGRTGTGHVNRYNGNLKNNNSAQLCKKHGKWLLAATFPCFFA